MSRRRVAIDVVVAIILALVVASGLLYLAFSGFGDRPLPTPTPTVRAATTMERPLG